MSKIQNQDIKSKSEVIAAGGLASDLPNDTKIYLTSLAKTLAEALVAGDLGDGEVPLRLFASSPADAILNIKPSLVPTRDGTGKVVPPQNGTLSSSPATTINLLTAATTGGTVQNEAGGAFALPSTTAGLFRRLVLAFSSQGYIVTYFSATSATVNGLTNAGELFQSVLGFPIGYVDLEAVSGGGFKTAGSATSIIENAVGGTPRIVKLGLGSGRSGSSDVVVPQLSHGFVVGDVLRHNGTNYAKADASTEANARAVGVVQNVVNANTFILRTSGLVTGSSLTAGAPVYLSVNGGAGLATATAPSGGTFSRPLGFAVSTTSYFLQLQPWTDLPILGGNTQGRDILLGTKDAFATVLVTGNTNRLKVSNATDAGTGGELQAQNSTKGWLLPAGTTAQRPTAPASGVVRYNTDINDFEGYSNGSWKPLGAGGGYFYNYLETFFNSDVEVTVNNGGVSATGNRTAPATSWASPNTSNFSFQRTTGSLSGTYSYVTTGSANGAAAFVESPLFSLRAADIESASGGASRFLTMLFDSSLFYDGTVAFEFSIVRYNSSNVFQDVLVYGSIGGVTSAVFQRPYAFAAALAAVNSTDFLALRIRRSAGVQQLAWDRFGYTPDQILTNGRQSVMGQKIFNKGVHTLNAEVVTANEVTDVIPSGETRLAGRLVVPVSRTIQVDGDLTVVGAITGSGTLTGSGTITSI
jgi:hypothetical protein